MSSRKSSQSQAGSPALSAVTPSPTQLSANPLPQRSNTQKHSNGPSNKKDYHRQNSNDSYSSNNQYNNNYHSRNPSQGSNSSGGERYDRNDRNDRQGPPGNRRWTGQHYYNNRNDRGDYPPRGDRYYDQDGNNNSGGGGYYNYRKQMSNGHDYNSNSGGPGQANSNIDRSQHHRLLFVLMNMVGSRVEVTVKNGVTYEGIFHSASPQDDMGVCLKMARMKMPSEPSTNGAATKKNTNPLIRNLVILGKDVCSFSCTSVDFTATAKAAREREAFATDTSISGATGDVRERELQKWISVEGEALEGDMDLDGAAKARGGKDTAWDQFTINEKLFGVTTDFKEELYTTTIDKDDPEYEKKAAIADRLAREIEKTATTNLHVAEERNQVVIEDGTTFAADEEDRYGAVLRYVPPQVRAKQAGLSAATGPRSVSTNSPAPVSATASLSLSTPTTKDKPSPVSDKPGVKSISEKHSVKFADTLREKPERSPAGSSRTDAEREREKILLERFERMAKLHPLPHEKGKTASPGAPLSKLTDKKTLFDNTNTPLFLSKEATVKHEVVSKFREFSAKEKQSLMERKQLLMKKEKHGILSEFKQFSVSFKLSTPPPEDLLPILRKEGAKSAGELKLSDEGLASGSNEAAAKVEKNDGKDVPKAEKKGADEKEASPVVKPAATEGEAPLEASKSPSPTPTTTSEVTTSSEKKSDFKFNVDAMEFKMNPGAVEFVPGGAAPNNAGYSKSPGQPDKSPFFGNKRPNRNSNYPSVRGQYVKGFQKNSSVSPKPSHVAPQWPVGKNPYRYAIPIIPAAAPMPPHHIPGVQPAAAVVMAPPVVPLGVPIPIPAGPPPPSGPQSSSSSSSALGSSPNGNLTTTGSANPSPVPPNGTPTPPPAGYEEGQQVMGQPMPGMMPGQAMYPVEGGYYPYPMPPYGAFRPPMVGRFVQQVPMAPGGQMAFVPYVPGATFAGPMPGAVYAAGPQGYPVAFQGPVAGGPGRGPFIPQIYQGPMMYPGEMVPFQQPMMIPVPGQGWQPAHPDGMHMMDGSQAGSAPSTGAPTPTPGSHQGSNIPGSPSMGGSVSADATTPGAE